MIEAQGISVALAGRKVVKELSFSARPGRLTAIIGPNGSGKTTTMKAVSGERKFEGSIRFNGRDLKSMNARDLALSRGVLAQSISLGFPFLVREVLEMGTVAGDTHDADEAARVMARALEAVDLNGFERRVATALSGGEQSRMHMARILCQIPEAARDDTPNWLLLDEPVASLDIKHQIAIMKIARGFAARGGGVIAVMHAESDLETVYGCRLSVSRERDSGLIRVMTPYIAA